MTGHMFNKSIYMTVRNRQIHRSESNSVDSRDWWEREVGYGFNGHDANVPR